MVWRWQYRLSPWPSSSIWKWPTLLPLPAELSDQAKLPHGLTQERCILWTLKRLTHYPQRQRLCCPVRIDKWSRCMQNEWEALLEQINDYQRGRSDSNLCDAWLTFNVFQKYTLGEKQEIMRNGRREVRWLHFCEVRERSVQRVLSCRGIGAWQRMGFAWAAVILHESSAAEPSQHTAEQQWYLRGWALRSISCW